MFYTDVLKGLNEAGAKYLVVGGVAVTLHGIPRMTYDLDLMIELSDENVSRVLTALSKLGFVPRLPVNAGDFGNPGNRARWKSEKHMLVFSFIQSGTKFRVVDIFIENPLDFDECYQARVTMSIPEVTIPLIGRDDLIRMKELARRKQDVADVESLRKVSG